MTRMQSIILIAIVGFYGFLFVGLFARALLALWRARSGAGVASVKMLSPSRVASKIRNRAWTRAVWRGSLAPDVH